MQGFEGHYQHHLSASELMALYRISSDDLDLVRDFGHKATDHMDGMVDEWYVWLRTQSEFDQFFSDRELLERVAQKAMDLGMHGLMMESHCQPETAMSDADQQVTPAQYKALIERLTIRDVHSKPADPANLDALRLQMDSIDEQVIELLEARMNLAREIGASAVNTNSMISSLPMPRKPPSWP